MVWTSYKIQTYYLRNMNNMYQLLISNISIWLFKHYLFNRLVVTNKMRIVETIDFMVLPIIELKEMEHNFKKNEQIIKILILL
jgi:hypothetical protein